ncbi:MAG: hypothetical protein AAGJ82_03825 [Bacteroidota bacterium]
MIRIKLLMSLFGVSDLDGYTANDQRPDRTDEPEYVIRSKDLFGQAWNAYAAKLSPVQLQLFQADLPALYKIGYKESLLRHRPAVNGQVVERGFQLLRQALQNAYLPQHGKRVPVLSHSNKPYVKAILWLYAERHLTHKSRELQGVLSELRELSSRCGDLLKNIALQVVKQFPSLGGGFSTGLPGGGSRSDVIPDLDEVAMDVDFEALLKKMRG